MRLMVGRISLLTALVLPVLLAGGMMFVELAGIGLTVHAGRADLMQGLNALSAKELATLPPTQLAARLERDLDMRLWGVFHISAMRHLEVERLMIPSPQKGMSQTPALRVTLNLRRDFITPIPRLLVSGNRSFRYRFQHLYIAQSGQK